MLISEVPDDRTNHWIRLNHQCRIPKRWIAVSVEAATEQGDNEQVQRWASGAAVYWRRGLKRGPDRREAVYGSAEALWKDVAQFCRPGTRTVVVTYSLGRVVRISRLLEILPILGFELEWCNLDRNVSTMAWRSDHGTLVLCDLFAWLPIPLHKISDLVGTRDIPRPRGNATRDKWDNYCLHDASVIQAAKATLLDYIELEQLGNWQPTGAGMSYATWRHKFMSHKVLVHNNPEVIQAERAAMHTGRAEAWKHGILSSSMWHEADMRTAYTRVAAECDVPARYKFTSDGLTISQYEKLSEIYRINCLVDVITDVPVVPHYNGNGTLWPVGHFRTWLWDVEVNELLAQNAKVKIRTAHVYTKAPVLSAWANWVLSIQDSTGDAIPPVVRAFTKHTGRALIGRLSLRAPRWEHYGTNPMGEIGLTMEVDSETGRTRRMMHIGNKTMVETARVEGRDSLPQITGWIMAECRIRLWWAMLAAGLDNIAHVDTDSLLVNGEGLRALQVAYGTAWRELWHVKGSWPAVAVYGPRNLRTGSKRKIAGVPVTAREIATDIFRGEETHSLAQDMSQGRSGAVTVTPNEWHVKRTDPRRRATSGAGQQTVAIRLPLD